MKRKQEPPSRAVLDRLGATLDAAHRLMRSLPKRGGKTQAELNEAGAMAQLCAKRLNAESGACRDSSGGA